MSGELRIRRARILTRLWSPTKVVGMVRKSKTSIMTIALEEARLAGEQGEVPVGAVIVSSDSPILVRTANRMKDLGDPTAHAEILAIRAACAAVGAQRLDSYDLYVTLEPCPMCAQAISFARIRRLYFAAYDSKGGGVEHGPRIFHATSCHHRPEIFGGIDERLASDLLKAFFSKRR